MKKLEYFPFRFALDFTYIDRSKALDVLSAVLCTDEVVPIQNNDEFTVIDKQLRYWHIVDDSSIVPMRQRDDGVIVTSASYRVKLISPTLKYESDLEMLHNLFTELQSAGADVNSRCGLAISIEVPDFSVGELRNVLNMMYSVGDLLYKALGVHHGRKIQWAMPLTDKFIFKLNTIPELSLLELEKAWFSEGYKEYELEFKKRNEFHRTNHYMVTLNDYFDFDKSVKFTLFNSTVDISSFEHYLTLVFLILNRAKGDHKETANFYFSKFGNEAFALNNWLLQSGATGDDFHEFRRFMLRYLPGNLKADDADFDISPELVVQDVEVLSDASEAEPFETDFTDDIIEFYKAAFPKPDEDEKADGDDF